jgi:hypothetical protein
MHKTLKNIPSESTTHASVSGLGQPGLLLLRCVLPGWRHHIIRQKHAVALPDHLFVFNDLLFRNDGAYERVEKFLDACSGQVSGCKPLETVKCTNPCHLSLTPQTG